MAFSSPANHSRSGRSTSLSLSASVSTSVDSVLVSVPSYLFPVSKQLSISDLSQSEEAELSAGCWRRRRSTESTDGDDGKGDQK